MTSKKSRIFLLFILALSLVLASCRPAVPTAAAEDSTPAAAVLPSPAPVSGFVTVKDGKFSLGGHPYYFVGANFWQGMNLGVNGQGGDRARLDAELDRLQKIGVTNLRVMASSEGPNTEPHRLVPALMTAPGVYDPKVLDGLDYLLAQMGKRGMRAVMVLNNFWYWSGGMAQYVSWSDKTSIPYPGDYNTYMQYTAQFYDCADCQTWYRAHIAKLVDHTDVYTGLKYKDSPAIFSWELANEPRRYPDAWIGATAAYIKSLDPNHMVTAGSEGTPPGEDIDFKQTHSSKSIDYATIHIWPQNWGWYNPQSPGTYKSAEQMARTYFQKHLNDATAIGKPLVLEEFGLARDWEPVHNIYDPKSTTRNRDFFYKAMFGAVYDSVVSGAPAAGDNFWAWAGQARPGSGWVGDPPHETPGWYSVYDTDQSTLDIISAHAAEMASEMAAVPK